jgi:hypothetical protein
VIPERSFLQNVELPAFIWPFVMLWQIILNLEAHLMSAPAHPYRRGIYLEVIEQKFPPPLLIQPELTTGVIKWMLFTQCYIGGNHK